MSLVKRTYSLPPDTLASFEKKVPPGARSSLVAALLVGWLEQQRRERLRREVTEGCRDMAELYLEVEKEYHALEEEVHHALEGQPRRGDVVRVKLDPVVGSEQAGERPALVISPDLINDQGPIILIAAITSQKTDRVYPFEVLLEPPEGGLSRRSKVMLMHLRSVDKRRLAGHYGKVSEDTLVQVDEAVKIATGLTSF